jgi:DNA-binding Xre family transcriptional regulator
MIVRKTLKRLKLSPENKFLLLGTYIRVRIGTMIENRIRGGLKAFGITSSYQLHKETGLSEVQAARLWKGPQLPSLSTAVIICDALECGIWDLVKRTSRAPRQNGSPKKPTGKKR